MHRLFISFISFLILFVLIMSVKHDCCAETYKITETYEIKKFTVEKWDYWGCFDKPCTIDPGKLNVFAVSAGAGNVGSTWYYMGRTGDKTFGLLEEDYAKKEKVYSIYFTPNDTLRLSHVLGAQGCLDNDAIYLKMLDLQGNKLKFQILLPDCVQKARIQK